MEPYSFGYNLKFVRHLRGLSRRQLAERADILYDSVRRLENSKNKPWPRTVKKLAEALGCYEYTLLGIRPGVEVVKVKRKVNRVKREVKPVTKSVTKPVEPLIKPLKSTFDKELFTKRLYQSRKRLDLKQCQVAAMIGKSKCGYGFYETGRIEPPLDVLVTLAKIYRVSVDWLLGLK